MRGLSAIYGREMRGYFNSPLAYVITTVFLVLVGLFFMNVLRDYIAFDQYLREKTLAMGQEVSRANVQEFLFRRLMGTIGVLSLFILPFITMSSFAEEHRSGTMELLMTSPIGQRDIVLAKFLAASTMFLMLLLISLGLISSLFFFGDPHPPSVLIGFLGIFLQGESFIVVGMFISSMTRSQVVAGIGGLGAALLLWLAGLIGDPTTLWGQWLHDLSLVSHFEDFSKGILDTKHLVFYVSFIFFGLFLTLRSIESLRYR